MSWRSRHFIVALAVGVSACAHAPPPPPAYADCRTPIPLELRLKRIERRLGEAYAHAPPLSAAEHAEMNRLAACFGGSVLGVGDGCMQEREAARASGVQQRNRIRSAAYSVPEYVTRAIGQPLGGPRANSLLVAMLIAEEARDALETHLASLPDGGAYRDDPLKLMLISADIQQALICDAEDQAAGRKTGLPFDPAARVPDGP